MLSSLRGTAIKAGDEAILIASPFRLCNTVFARFSRLCEDIAETSRNPRLPHFVRKDGFLLLFQLRAWQSTAGNETELFEIASDSPGHMSSQLTVPQRQERTPDFSASSFMYLRVRKNPKNDNFLRFSAPDQRCAKARTGAG